MSATRIIVTVCAMGAGVASMSCGNPGSGNGPGGVCSGDATCVSTLAAAGVDTCAITGDGSLRCWGDNSQGQLGDGTTVNRSSPVAVPGLQNVTGVAMAQWHTCALGPGQVMCWGSSLSGELGFHTSLMQVTSREPAAPEPAAALTGAVAIGAGMSSTWSIGPGAGVRALGQFAGGTPAAVAVPGLDQAVEIAVRETHGCARLTDGTAACWGDNAAGDLGDGTQTPRQWTPAAVSGLGGVVQIAVGRTDSCAVLNDGTLKCWGATADGQQHLLPTVVDGIANVRRVAVGYGFTCALTSDGTITCWGVNGSGQLGRGTMTQRETPGPVAGLSGVGAIVAGANHACALGGDGTVSCWGDGSSGQVGNGTMLGSATPARVGF
jgi:alpha-tubulin suppressor-like RCC1 family protein